MTFSKYLKNTAIFLALLLSPSFVTSQTCQEQFSTPLGFWSDATLFEVTTCLEAGVDVNAIVTGERTVASRARTVLHLAVQNSENPRIIAALIEAGADVNAFRLHGYPPIFVARNADVIKVLVEAGADIEARPHSGNTPLINAVFLYSVSTGNNRAKKFEIIRILLELGADINAQNVRGETVLHMAADRTSGRGVGFSEIFLFLIANGADMEISTFLRSRDRPAFTALNLLLWRGAGGENEAHLILSLGADATVIVGGLNQSTAHAALCRNERPFGHRYLGGSNMLETLLKLGADPTIVAIDGRSAIGSAFYYECYEDIRLFRKYGYLDRQPALTYE